MLRTIVEGEPGIFPDPVARLMRGIGGIFRRRGPADERAGPGAATGADEPSAADAAAGTADPPRDHEPGSSDAPATGDEPGGPGAHGGETR